MTPNSGFIHVSVSSFWNSFRQFLLRDKESQVLLIIWRNSPLLLWATFSSSEEVTWSGTRLSGNPGQEGRSKGRGGSNPHITQHAHGQLQQRNLTLGLPTCRTGKRSNLMRPETTRFNKIDKTFRLSKGKHFCPSEITAFMGVLFFLVVVAVVFPPHGTWNSVSKCNQEEDGRMSFPCALKNSSHLLSTSLVPGAPLKPFMHVAH